jgi:chromosome segregation ATPase
MARGVTQDQVTDAADALLARGERPTIEKVRAKLGTGSPNTLLRLLEVWWAELAGRLAAQARAQLPGVPETVQRAMMTLWSEAVVASQQAIGSRYEERERGIADREAVLQVSLEQAAASQEAQRLALAQAAREHEAVKEGLANEQRRTEDLQQSLSSALSSLNEAQSTISALRRASEETQKAFRLDRERAEATQQRWLREVDHAREDAKTAAREAKAALIKLEAEAKRCQKLEGELALQKRQARQQLASLKRRLKSRGTKIMTEKKPGKKLLASVKQMKSSVPARKTRIEAK